MVSYQPDMVAAVTLHSLWRPAPWPGCRRISPPAGGCGIVMKNIDTLPADRRLLLVFGHNGQVATALRETALPAGWSVRTVGRAEADITDADAVERIVALSGAALVINAAAYTAVD